MGSCCSTPVLRCSICFAGVQYLETDELLLGEAVAVDDLNLFDQGALSTLCSSWHTSQIKSLVKDISDTRYKGIYIM